MTDVTASQVKAARALLDWKQPDLAKAAGVGLATIKRFETGVTSIPVVKSAIVAALEKAGMVFESDGKFVGVKMKIKRVKQ
jgi:transcriptional regulator with XRE-family HTH domain